ncbi:unnamed protein product, partial [Effrenium voratum]
QAYLLQLIIEVFPDKYHLPTLEHVLATCAQVHWSVDLKPLTEHLLRRLTTYLAEGLSDERSSLDVFGIFHSHLKQLHHRPRTAATPLQSLLKLQLELCIFVLALETGRDACFQLLVGTEELLDESGAVCLETNLAE